MGLHVATAGFRGSSGRRRAVASPPLMIDATTLRSWLHANPDDSAELTLGRGEVRALCDELQRLLQSNDRLRKQNKKVRAKVAKLRGGEEDPEDAAAADSTD